MDSHMAGPISVKLSGIGGGNSEIVLQQKKSVIVVIKDAPMYLQKTFEIPGNDSAESSSMYVILRCRGNKNELVESH